GLSAHARHRHRDESPADHDPRDPEARAHAFEDQVARHLEGEVAEEEDPRAEAVDGLAEAEVLLHLERGEADVHAVEEGDDVEQQGEGWGPPGPPPVHPGYGTRGLWAFRGAPCETIGRPCWWARRRCSSARTTRGGRGSPSS